MYQPKTGERCTCKRGVQRDNCPECEGTGWRARNVGCGGRHSTIRAKAGLKSDDYGAPMDVMWFRLSRKLRDSEETFGHIEGGRMMVMLNRTDYWQCAYVIPKGGIDRVKADGLAAFRKRATSRSERTSSAARLQQCL